MTKLYAFLCALSFSVTAVFGQVAIVGFNVNGVTGPGASPLTPSSSINNVTVIGLTRGSGLGNNATAANSWGGSANVAATSQADAETKGNFFTFSITANAEYALSLASINPLWMRRSGAGPSSIVLQVRVGTGAFQNIGTTLTLGNTSNTNFGSIDLTTIPTLQAVGPNNTVTFRLVAYGGTTGALYIADGNAAGDDLAVNGTVTLLPPTTPANLVLAGGSNPNSLVLNWTDNSATEDNFVIERSVDGNTNWTTLSSTVPANTTTYTDNTPAGVAYFYRVKAVNTAGSSAYVTTSGALPVTYLNFTARFTELKQVRINWATSFEQTNAYFALERSSDLTNYSELGRVVGKGTTQVRQEYGFTDEAPLAGYNYYRLKQVDADGRVSYNRPVSVLNEASLDAQLVVYPNPAASTVQLKLNQSVNAASAIDGRGGRQRLAVNDGSINVGDLASGVYLLELEMATGQLLRQRIVKQ